LVSASGPSSATKKLVCAATTLISAIARIESM
jgi:hypothetical protein